MSLSDTFLLAYIVDIKHKQIIQDQNMFRAECELPQDNLVQE